MAGFCGNCGAPQSEPSGFCGACGARAGHTQSGQPAAVAAPAASKSGGGGLSVLKIVVIVAGVLFVFGAVSVGGMYYAAHRYIKLAEDVTGIKAGDVVHSIREAADNSSHEA